MNHADPEELEKRRIAEMKGLSYVQRLERLMAILEISYGMRNAAKITEENNERANSEHLEIPS